MTLIRSEFFESLVTARQRQFVYSSLIWISFSIVRIAPGKVLLLSSPATLVVSIIQYGVSIEVGVGCVAELVVSVRAASTFEGFAFG